jgi:RNA polymerase sigma-70 factor (ECF subfamily)
MSDELRKSPEPTVAPPASLLERVQLRHQLAWERLVTLYAPLVYHWCRQERLSPTQALHMGQEVFQAVIQDIGGFRGDRQGVQFRTWLREILDGKLRAVDRGSTLREPAGQPPQDGPRNSTPTEYDDDRATVRDDGRLVYMRAVELIRSEFPEASWQAFWRVVVEVQNPEDVARALSLSLEEVYLAKAHVGRRLREEFAGLLEM